MQAFRKGFDTRICLTALLLPGTSLRSCPFQTSPSEAQEHHDHLACITASSSSSICHQSHLLALNFFWGGGKEGGQCKALLTCLGPF